MKLTLKRNVSNSSCTIGKLYVDGKFECFTLEDVVRTGPKVDSQTAIPVGTYSVCIDFSNRFQRLMPHILNVPNFTGVRIHTGNTDANTDGCILVGYLDKGDHIEQSHVAYAALFAKLQRASDITLTIA